MAEDLLVSLPAPKYNVGSVVLALINHQLRYSQVESIHLNAQIEIDVHGPSFFGEPRWEYTVAVSVKSEHGEEETEIMRIAEQTILQCLQDG